MASNNNQPEIPNYSFARLFLWIAQWANCTFGDEIERGPVGPLKHLLKEIWVELLGLPSDMTLDEVMDQKIADHPRLYDDKEWADALILWCDAYRRAARGKQENAEKDSLELVERILKIAHHKMIENAAREWPKPADHSQRPIEHDRSKNEPPQEQTCVCGGRALYTSLDKDRLHIGIHNPGPGYTDESCPNSGTVIPRTR